MDRNLTEMEFMRRRMAGGGLYAMLEQESKDYLRPGAFTDADMELLGKHLARVCVIFRVQASAKYAFFYPQLL